MNSYAYSLVYLFTNVISFFLTAVLFMMFLRAVLSWLPLSDDNVIEEFVYAVTEPFIIPVRMILERFDSLNGLPVDISFFVSFILLSVITDILSAFKV